MTDVYAFTQAGEQAAHDGRPCEPPASMNDKEKRAWRSGWGIGQATIRWRARTELVEYLLGDEYRSLLRRAVAARLGTTSMHGAQHMKALDLIDAAFPELSQARP